jgi:secondary thiamine-phosphate synthase enzyme
MMKKMSVSTKSHTEFIDITSEISSVVEKSGVKDGMVVVYVPHTTAGITINESADPAVVSDIINTLEKNVPWDDRYRHSEGNAAAHIKASMMGFSVDVMIENGSLVLGTWQGIFFCEFDGPRSRKIVVNIIKSS